MHVESDAVAVNRSKSQAMNGEHLLIVHRYLDGFSRGRAGDFNIDRDPGSIYVIDSAQRMEHIQTRYSTQSIFIPKAVAGFDHDRHPVLTKFPSGQSIGRLLSDLFNDLFGDLLQNHSFEIAKLEQLKACLEMAMGADVREGDIRRHVRDALRNTICTYVERNLEHENLSVTSILKEFGVSRASLFRMFEDRGGVREFITSRRLLSAVLDLSDGPVLRGDIAMTAEKWGFTSSGNFNRAVRREYGVAPGSLVDLPREEQTRPSPRMAAVDFHRALQRSFDKMTQSKIRLPS